MPAIKTMFNQPFRFVMTVFGVALCAVLMLFLMALYKGVADGSVEYIRATDADLWVLQCHATNILRSTSLLQPKHSKALKEIPGISSVSPVLFILATVKLPTGPATLYLTGYDPESGHGGPPSLAKGRNVLGNKEIVVDRSFAAKYRIHIGDTLRVKNDSLVVVGLSRGTNMFVIQYAFITLAESHRLIGMAGIVSCYLVSAGNPADLNGIIAGIKTSLPDVAVFDRNEFLRNNIHEMESGLLPLLYVVAFIGAIVLTAILSLILSLNVLERRKDYAVMKALGSPGGFIPGLVIRQSLFLSGCGVVVAVAFFFPLMKVVELLSPEISVRSSPFHVLVVIAGILFISLVSSILPNHKLLHIYPMEVFK